MAALESLDGAFELAPVDAATFRLEFRDGSRIKFEPNGDVLRSEADVALIRAAAEKLAALDAARAGAARAALQVYFKLHV